MLNWPNSQLPQTSVVFIYLSWNGPADTKPLTKKEKIWNYNYVNGERRLTNDSLSPRPVHSQAEHRMWTPCPSRTSFLLLLLLLLFLCARSKWPIMRRLHRNLGIIWLSCERRTAQIEREHIYTIWNGRDGNGGKPKTGTQSHRRRIASHIYEISSTGNIQFSAQLNNSVIHKHSLQLDLNRVEVQSIGTHTANAAAQHSTAQTARQTKNVKKKRI